MAFAKPMCALREARPTAGDGPRRRRGAPFLTGRANCDASKNDGHPVKNSAISVGRWRCRKECPFLLLLFFWANKRKVKIPRATTKAEKLHFIRVSEGVQPKNMHPFCKNINFLCLKDWISPTLASNSFSLSNPYYKQQSGCENFGVAIYYKSIFYNPFILNTS
jgi:hypothetical protein